MNKIIASGPSEDKSLILGTGSHARDVFLPIVIFAPIPKVIQTQNLAKLLEREVYLCCFALRWY